MAKAKTIEVVCPKCGLKAKVTEAEFKKGVKCSKCGVRMMLPEKAAVYAKAYAAAKKRRTRRIAAKSLLRKSKTSMPAGYGYGTK